MSKLLEKLNIKQKEAVDALDGPVMVIAGAGSGKTRVLTHRLAYLIECGVDSQNILAVTFTNKAAKEMRERVESLFPEETILSWVMTFHATCARLLRRHAELLGYKRNFDILDDEDVIKILKEVIKSLNLDPKNYNPKKYHCFISGMKNGKIFNLNEEQMADYEMIYRGYSNYLKKENLMDFDDLLLLTVKLFEENHDVLEYYQDLFRYIMIDEFQDTNKIQFKLVCLLADKYKNIFIVGDEDQSIYSFRGADIGNISSFMDRYKPKKIVLDTNYRSTQNILNVANSLICKNKSRIKKELKSVLDEGSLVVFKNLESAYEEETYIIRTIDDLYKKGYKYKDIAIFYRNNALSRGIEEIFLKVRMPYKIFGGISFFGRKEIKDIIAYFKLILDINNVWAFKRVINVPKRGVGNTSIDKLTAYLEQEKTLAEAIESLNNPKVIEFVNMIKRISKKLESQPIMRFVDIIIEETGYKKMLEDEQEDDRLDNINEFNSVLAEADETYEGEPFEKLQELLNYLTLRTDKDETQTELSDYVNLMTYHQAKGLEFKVVIMMAMEDGVFPRSLIDNKELEEERRVAYVGITRAKDRLYLTCARSRRLYGQVNLSLPSSFIREIDEKYVQGIKKEEKKESFIFDEIKKEEVVFKAGDKIDHQVFGEGIVVAVDGEFIKVAFAVPYGIKKLFAKHPSITKLS